MQTQFARNLHKMSTMAECQAQTECCPAQSAGKFHKHFQLSVRECALVYVYVTFGYCYIFVHHMKCVRRWKIHMTEPTSAAKQLYFIYLTILYCVHLIPTTFWQKDNL